VLERRFAAIGARVKVAGPAVGGPRIDIRSDRRGEFFDISFAGSGDDAGVEVVDIAPRSLIVPGSSKWQDATLWWTSRARRPDSSPCPGLATRASSSAG
jgi:hypothetical protein